MFARLDGARRKRCRVWVNEGGGPPPLRRGLGSPPPPTAPQTVEHPSGSHIGWRPPPWLEPVPEISWLGKHLIFSGPNAGVFPKGQGWTSLVGLWIRTTVLPLTKKHARRILGRYVWALRPNAGYAPFLSGWWAYCQWGANSLQNCPLCLLTSLLHCLIMSLQGWTPKLLLPLSICGGGILFVDAAFDVEIFKIVV